MSSDDSRTTSSSRLSQFGLYRTIDARTEEFLRLSRKRQIRQGCACAAVSTAITVTVVVTVILVYEYTMNLDSNTNQKSRKPNWHGLFNDTAPFDAKYNKAKINIDPTTLKLLPLILKALNHNRHLEKLLDETSTDPSYERKLTTQNSFKKNIFSALGLGKKSNIEQRNAEHRILPVVTLKNTFNNLDYFKKIRQNQEYRRILNYFAKMINHDSLAPISLEIKDNTEVPKTSNDSTSTTRSIIDTQTKRTPLQNSTTFNETTIIEVKATKSTRTTPSETHIQSVLKSHSESKVSSLKPKNSSGNPTKISLKETTQPIKQTITCKCSKKFIELLSKLVMNIQELTPEILLYKLACNGDEDTSTSTPPIITPKAKSTVLSTLPEAVDEMSSFTIEPSLQGKKTVAQYLPQDIKTVHAVIPNSIDSIFHPKYKFDIDDEFFSNDNFKYTSMKSHVDPTLKNQAIIETSTKPMQKSTNFWPMDERKGITLPMTPETPRVKTILPLFDDDFDIEDYFSDKDQPDSKALTEQTSLPNSYSKDQENIIEKSKKPKILPQSDDEPITFLNLASLVNAFKDIHEIKEPTSTTTKPTHYIKTSRWFNSIQSKIKQDKTKFKEDNHILSTKESINNISVTLKPKIENKTQNPCVFKRKGLSGTKDTNIISKVASSKLNDYDKIIMTIPGIRMNLTKINKTAKDEAPTTPKLTVTEVQKSRSTFGGLRSIMNLTSSKSWPHEIPNTYFALHAENLTSIYNKTSRKKLNSSIRMAMENKSLELNNKNIQESTTNSVLDYDEFRFLNEDIQEKEAQEYDSKVSKYEKYDYAGQTADKMGDTSKFLKSMLPISRPTYLEIQRNDWKHDNDYENMDNIFDSP